MKIIHTADWHIDANIVEAGRCLQFLCDQADQIRPDLVIVAGDMFNSADIRLDSEAARLAMRTLIALKHYAKEGVIVLIGTPSHDGLAAKIFDGIDKIWVCDRPGPIVFHRPEMKYDHFIVSVLPQPTKQYLESQVKGDIEDINLAMSEALTAICAGFGSARSQYPNGPHICVGHFSVRGAKISPTQQMMGYDIELGAAQLQLADPTLWCLGHIHHAQEVAPKVFYSGSLYRVDFGERESRPGFWVHEIISAQDPKNADKWLHDLQSVFMETPAATMNKIRFEISGDDPGENPTILIDDAEIEDKMQVEVKCYTDQAELVQIEKIRQDLLARGAKEVEIILQRIPRPNIRSAKILAVDSLREKLIARAELTNETVAPGILEKADMIETMKVEAVLNIIKKQFQKAK